MAQDDKDSRLNGLMAAMGRKEQENAQLRAQLAQLTDQQGAPTGAGLADHGWEPGTRLEVGDDGQLVEYQPPTPFNPNETSRAGRGADPMARKVDDGSAEWARDQMVSALGGKPEKSWLDS